MTEPFIDPSELAFTPDDQVTWATARIREYCRWHIFPSIQSTVTVDYDGGSLMLPTLHLTSLDSVTTHISDGSTLTDTVVPALSLVAQENGVVSRQRYYSWPCGYGRATVVFTHGYDELPEALRGVAVSAATRVPAQLASVSSETAGGVSRTYGSPMSGGFAASGFTASEQAVLDAYRLPPRA